MGKAYKRYIWLLLAIYVHKKLTFKELSNLWREHTFFYKGKPLSLRTFHHHRKMIENEFGIIIACEHDSNRYFIKDLDVILNDSYKNWVFNTKIIESVLDEGYYNETIKLPDLSLGLEYFSSIMDCIENGHEVKLFYQDNRGFETVSCLSPLGIKYHRNRWYVLGFYNGTDIISIPFDSISKGEITLKGNKFNNAGFRINEILKNSIGISIPIDRNGKNKPETVTLKAFGKFADYLRNHPFHPSQVEINSFSQSTTFEYKLYITEELVNEILLLGDKVKVIYPSLLQDKLMRKLDSIKKIYL